MESSREMRGDNTPAAAALEAVVQASPERPFVVAQLGQSLDGRIATQSGESRWINGSCALDHVHRLRAAVDAVVVGIGTVLADDPLLNVRRVVGRHPARVVIDPRGRLTGSARCLNGADGTRRIVIRAREHPGRRPLSSPMPDGVEILEIPTVNGQFSPPDIVDALFGEGLCRLLIEGGASTVSSFVESRAVDRLHLLVAPMILGSGKTGLSLTPIDRLADAIRLKSSVHVLMGGDVLFDCDLRSVQNGS